MNNNKIGIIVLVVVLILFILLGFLFFYKPKNNSSTTNSCNGNDCVLPIVESGISADTNQFTN